MTEDLATFLFFLRLAGLVPAAAVAAGVDGPAAAVLQEALIFSIKFLSLLEIK